MRHKLPIAAVAVGAVSSVCDADPAAVHGFTVPATTSTPYTYCMSYQPDYETESFLDALEASPPDLFHIGYQIPFKGGLGPTYGADLFTDDILSPDQVHREIERLQGPIGKMRAAGVQRLIPYVYSMAFFGHPDKRTGFFHFYDDWNEYRAFGLGPKPDADPSLWSQVRGPRPLGGGPPDALHYDPCINHPAWSEYLDLVVRQLTAAGYDGMFFDVNTLYCFCPHCQEKFDIYLLDRYGREGLRDVFGTDDHRVLDIPTIYRDFEDTILKAIEAYLNERWTEEDLDDILGDKDAHKVKLEDDWRLLRCYMQDSQGEYPPTGDFEGYVSDRFGGKRMDEISAQERNDFTQAVLRRCFREFLDSQWLATLLESRFGSSDIKRRCLSKPGDLLLWVEGQRFWCENMAAQFTRLKGVGRATLAEEGRSGDFYTVANLGSMATVDGLNKRRVNAIDLVHWAPASDLQMLEEMNRPGSLESGVILSNIFSLRWAMGAGTQVGTLQYKVGEDIAADLAEAEVAAGGGGAYIQPGIGAPESRKRWQRFFTEHADLWDGGESWARVGLLFWSDQVFYEYPEHLAMTRRLVHVFSETQTPFDIVTEEGIHSLSQYEVVIAPMLRFLDTEQIETFIQYVKQGGNLVFVQPFGTEDEYARPRQADPLAGVCPAGTGFQAHPCGEGKILRLKAATVPARKSDLWCLMEERANAFVQARDILDEARRADIKNGVDLGPAFIQRLEKSLDLTLRWCPAGTDAGVYVHAYQLPRRGEQQERVIVHAVNYHSPIVLKKRSGEGGDPVWSPQMESSEPLVAQNLQIAVPLPPAANVKRVKALSPTDALLPVEWSMEGKLVILSVQQIRIYQALVIELENVVKVGHLDKVEN